MRPIPPRAACCHAPAGKRKRGSNLYRQVFAQSTGKPHKLVDQASTRSVLDPIRAHIEGEGGEGEGGETFEPKRWIPQPTPLSNGGGWIAKLSLLKHRVQRGEGGGGTRGTATAAAAEERRGEPQAGRETASPQRATTTAFGGERGGDRQRRQKAGRPQQGQPDYRLRGERERGKRKRGDG